MRSDCCITVTVYQLWQDHNPQHSTTKLRQDGFSFRALTFDLMLWDGLRSLSYFNVKKKPHIKQSRSSEHLHLASLFHVGGFQESFTNAHKVYPVYPICTQKLSHGIASKSVKCVCFWRLCGTVPKSVAGFPFKKSSCTFEVYTKSTQGPNVKHVATTRWAVWFSTNNGFDYTKYKLFHLLILQIHSIQVFQIQNNRHCSQRIDKDSISQHYTSIPAASKKKPQALCPEVVPLCWPSYLVPAPGRGRKVPMEGTQQNLQPPINNQKQNKREMLCEAISWMGHQKQRMSKKSVSSLSFRYLGAGVSAIKSWCSQDNLNSGSNSMQGQALSYPRLSHWVGIELYREATFEASAHRALLCLALWARLERLNGLGPSHSTQMSGLTSFTRPHCAQVQSN